MASRDIAAPEIRFTGETLLPAAIRPWYKRFLPRSLLGRALLILVSPLVLLQVISAWIFYDRHYETITRRLSEAVAGDVAITVEMLVRPDPLLESDEMFDLAQQKMNLELRLLPGAELGETQRPFWPSVLDRKLRKALRKTLSHPFVVDTVSLSKQIEIRVELGDRILQVLVPRERLFSSSTYIFIMWMVGASIVLFVVAFLFMRNQVRPIRRLAKAAERFGKGQDNPNFRPEGATEVRLAATEFLRMRERIKRQIQQRTEMLAGVSHDLHTPLTRMKLELAMLGGDPEVESLKTDVAQMELMIDDYLAFARGEGTEQPRDSNVSEQLREVVSQFRREGENIDLHLEQELHAPLRRAAFRRCIANLVNNARRYGEQVAVTAGRRKHGIEILIDDDGPGIPADKREDVFKPFHRLEESRNPETGGTGLGLSIARDVVRGHGGELTLHDAPGGGLRARIWLPT